jgi:hypothetical protein
VSFEKIERRLREPSLRSSRAMRSLRFFVGSRSNIRRVGAAMDAVCAYAYGGSYGAPITSPIRPNRKRPLVCWTVPSRARSRHPGGRRSPAAPPREGERRGYLGPTADATSMNFYRRRIAATEAAQQDGHVTTRLTPHRS